MDQAKNIRILLDEALFKTEFKSNITLQNIYSMDVRIHREVMIFLFSDEYSLT